MFADNEEDWRLMEIPPDTLVEQHARDHVCEEHECDHVNVQSGMDVVRGQYLMCWYCPDCGYLDTQPPMSPLAKRAAEWVRSEEGQKAIRDGLARAKKTIEEFTPKPLTWEDLNTPMI